MSKKNNSISWWSIGLIVLSGLWWICITWFSCSTKKVSCLSQLQKFSTRLMQWAGFFITLVGAMAQWERENLAERVRMGMERRASEGKFNGSAAPYGYRLEGDKLVIERSEERRVGKECSSRWLQCP